MTDGDKQHTSLASDDNVALISSASLYWFFGCYNYVLESIPKVAQPQVRRHEQKRLYHFIRKEKAPIVLHVHF